MSEKIPTAKDIAAADINQLRQWITAGPDPETRTDWVIVASILARIARLQDEELTRRGPRPLIDFVMPVITITMALWVILGSNVPPC